MANRDYPRVFSKRSGAEPPPEDAILVDRTTEWGNPFVIGRDGDRKEVLRKYRRWFRHSDQKEFRRRVRRELVEKDLVCWCAPSDCHADILLEFANRLRFPR